MTIHVDYQLSQHTDRKGEPVRQSNFEIEIPHVADLWMVVTTTSLPNPSVEQIEVHHGNEKLKIAGAPDFPNITVELRDVLDPDIVQSLYDWYLRVYNPENSKLGFASAYKEQATLAQYDSHGDHVRSWTLLGVWPTSINFGSLDYSSKEAVAISVDLSVDRCILAGKVIANENLPRRVMS